jgi:hypothetical protein
MRVDAVMKLFKGGRLSPIFCWQHYAGGEYSGLEYRGRFELLVKSKERKKERKKESKKEKRISDSSYNLIPTKAFFFLRIFLIFNTHNRTLMSQQII